LKLKIDPDLHISGNSDTLKQIIVALLDNANKYSPENSAINLVLKKFGPKVQLSVEDFGIGIPDDQKDLIFQRFYRVDTSHSTEIKGSGLGLSIVSQLVKLNNGVIQVLDNQPKGSIFQVSFEAVE
jgi:Osmosensitive K+ channel histidine kinase